MAGEVLEQLDGSVEVFVLVVLHGGQHVTATAGVLVRVQVAILVLFS